MYFQGFKDEAIKAIDDANTPYRPVMCSSDLASKILKAAKQVKLFSTVKHLAAANNLSSILDTCLYGRKNLIDMYLDFRPAALGSADIADGDFNAICFGPNLIDPACLKARTVGLVLDLDLLLDNRNPAIFFKQRDFGYYPELRQSVRLGNSKLLFCHTRPSENAHTTFHSLEIQFEIYEFGIPLFISNLPKYSFMSNNLPLMQQILTLNFFRFIDSLKKNRKDGRLAIKKIDEIYNEISKLTDLELINFLTEIGKKMTCTTEFNFSGAYKIDLNALKEIEIYQEEKKQFSVNLKTLIEQSNCESNEITNKLAELAPELFKSKRFTQYLSSQRHKDTKKEFEEFS